VSSPFRSTGRDGLDQDLSMPDTLTLLGYLGAAIGVCVVIPQIARILRNPDTPGVSAVTWGMTTLACLLWLSYGLRMHEAPQVPGNIVLIMGAAAITLLVPNEWSVRRRATTLASVVVGTLLVLSQVPATWVGYAAFLLAVFSVWPQVIESVGTYRAGATSAVSVGSMSLRIGSQVCWLSYAIGTSDRAVTLAATMALSTAILIVSLELGARSRGARLLVDAAV
jgi:uncharacterized protein with PQ loop repeat